MKAFARLFAYNARLLMATGYWLYVLPIAVCSLVVFWFMALASQFTASTAAKTPELVAAMVAAFLCAHILAPEYRHRVDELVLVRPVSFRKITFLRLVAVYALVAVLTGLMLISYRFWIKAEFDPVIAALAGIPSVLFLSTLAVAVATCWRNPLMGVAAAAVYWGFDLARGPQINPLATLQSYSASLASADFPADWRIAKFVLLALSLLCVWYARQALRRPMRGLRLRGVARSTGLVLLAAALMISGGVGAKLARGRQIERTAPEKAAVWYFAQFQPYGSLPAAYVAGPAFARYVGYGTKLTGDDMLVRWIFNRPQFIRSWLEVANGHPQSRWAANALAALIQEANVTDKQQPTLVRGQMTPEGKPVGLRQAEVYYQTLLKEHPDSPFAPFAAVEVAHLAETGGDPTLAEQARLLVLQRFPTSPQTAQAAAGLARYYRSLGRTQDAVKVARSVLSAGRESQTPTELLEAGDLLAACGDLAGARDAYGMASQAATRQAAEIATRTSGSPQATMLKRKDVIAVRNAANERLAGLQGK